MISLSPAHQRDWVVRLASVGLIAGMVLSWRAWTNIGRALPTAPFFGWPDGFLPLPSTFLALATIGAFATWMIRPSWNRAGMAGCALVLALALLDQMRWQPWVWHYLLLVTPLLLIRSRNNDIALLCARITTIGFYFWAGFHKIGAPFQQFYKNTLVRPWLADATPFQESAISAAGYAIPVVEILVALLLTLRYRLMRRAGVLLLAAIHVGILGWLILRGLNLVVWPWNLTAPAIAAVLFWPPPVPKQKKSLSERLDMATAWVLGGVILLVVLLPALSWSGRWDRSLSFHLYSGRAQRVIIAFPPTIVEQLPERVARWAKPSSHWKGKQQIDLEDWALRELRVALVGENRVVLKLCQEIIGTYPIESSETFIYRDYPTMLDWREFSYLKPGQVKNLSRLPRLGPARSKPVLKP